MTALKQLEIIEQILPEEELTNFSDSLEKSRDLLTIYSAEELKKLIVTPEQSNAVEKLHKVHFPNIVVPAKEKRNESRP